MKETTKGEDLPSWRLPFPPDKAPKGRAPVGVRPLSCRTDSDSSLKNNKDGYENELGTVEKYDFLHCH